MDTFPGIMSTETQKELWSMYILCVRGHYEIYRADGAFYCSADTRREALEEIEEWERETTA